jgi:hypothetical protein
MAFRTDYTNVGNLMVPPGEYEVVVKGAYFDKAKTTNKDYFSIPLVIRNDVEQKYQNARIWDGIFGLTDKAIAWKTNNISSAVKIPEGAEFEDLDDWGRYIIDKPMRVKVKHEDYEGRTQARIQFYNETKFPDVKHVHKEKDDTEPAPEEKKTSSPYLGDQVTVTEIISDDDIPF